MHNHANAIDILAKLSLILKNGVNVASEQHGDETHDCTIN